MIHRFFDPPGLCAILQKKLSGTQRELQYLAQIAHALQRRRVWLSARSGAI